MLLLSMAGDLHEIFNERWAIFIDLSTRDRSACVLEKLIVRRIFFRGSFVDRHVSYLSACYQLAKIYRANASDVARYIDHRQVL